MTRHTFFTAVKALCRCVFFWVASTDATHIFVWNWGSNMAAFPVMVPVFFFILYALYCKCREPPILTSGMHYVR